MFCSECGKQNLDNTKFCIECGTAIFTKKNENAESSQKSNLNSKKDIQLSNKMTMAESIASCFSKYANFDGRASRSEYWWFYLFCLLLDWAGTIVEGIQKFDGISEFPILTTLIYLVLFLPELSVATRRLHDTGRSGWNQLWILTIIGIIPVFIWLASKSDDHNNKYERIR